MLINHSIGGKVTINGVMVACKYTIENVTTGFNSGELNSDIGYFNTNLTNFPNTIFNHKDLIMIKLYVRYNGINYGYTSYVFLDVELDHNSIDVQLQPHWNYNSSILLTKDKNKVNVKFITTSYQYIVYILYMLYDNRYIEIERKQIASQNINMTINVKGSFKIVGYVLDGTKLLSYTSKMFDIEEETNNNIDDKQSFYFDWE